MEPWLYFGEKRKKFQSHVLRDLENWQSGKFCVNLHGAQAYIASFVIFLYDNSWSRLGKMTLKFGGGISSPLRDRGQKVLKIDP